MRKHVLFVEDDLVVRENYVELLEDEGFDVTGHPDHVSALASATDSLPDLALLDISLNDERDAGFHLCADLRRLSKRLPIMFFTSHDNEADKISGIRLGADDYVTKDVSIRYLATRMEALLRRCEELSGPSCIENEQAKQNSVGKLSVDLATLSVHWCESKVSLSLNQIHMIHALIERPGHVISFSRLMRAAGIHVEPNTITAHVRAIRSAFITLDPDFCRIESVRGAGYRWLAD